MQAVTDACLARSRSFDGFLDIFLGVFFGARFRRFPALDDLRRGALDRGDVDIVFDQAAHARIARIGGVAAKYDGDQVVEL